MANTCQTRSLATAIVRIHEGKDEAKPQKTASCSVHGVNYRGKDAKGNTGAGAEEVLPESRFCVDVAAVVNLYVNNHVKHKSSTMVFLAPANLLRLHAYPFYMMLFGGLCLIWSRRQSNSFPAC